MINFKMYAFDIKQLVFLINVFLSKQVLSVNAGQFKKKTVNVILLVELTVVRVQQQIQSVAGNHF